jgi:hypothetical protein
MAMTITRTRSPAGREGELKRLVFARFAEYPLRRRELDSLYSAVQWSLQNPLGHLFTSQDALGVPSKPKGGRDEEAEGLFVFPPEKRPCRKRGLPDTHRPGALGARPSGYRSDGHGKLTTSIRITKKRAGGLGPQLSLLGLVSGPAPCRGQALLSVLGSGHG